MTYDTQQTTQLHTFLKQPHTSSEYERARALLALSQGKKRKDIAEIFEINIATLDRWQTKFKRAGTAGITNQAYPGNHHLLSKEQKKRIKTLITEKTPTDTHLADTRFWTVKLLKKLIQQEYAVIYASEASYRKLFYSFGFTYHKPGKHNRNQREKDVEQFRVTVKKRSDNTRGWAVWYW